MWSVKCFAEFNSFLNVFVRFSPIFTDNFRWELKIAWKSRMKCEINWIQMVFEMLKFRIDFRSKPRSSVSNQTMVKFWPNSGNSEVICKKRTAAKAIICRWITIKGFKSKTLSVSPTNHAHAPNFLLSLHTFQSWKAHLDSIRVRKLLSCCMSSAKKRYQWLDYASVKLQNCWSNRQLFATSQLAIKATGQKEQF